MQNSRRLHPRIARLSVLGVVALSLVALLVAIAAPQIGSAQAASNADSHSDHSDTQHVFIIMMENTGFETLLGNSNAPWINTAIQRYGVAGNYYGVTHPSQPNYIAATAGSNYTVTSDSDATLNVPNIVDQLESHGKSWKAYMQSFALCDGNVTASSCGNQLYERKHDPFITYDDVRNNPERVANIVDYSQLSTDLDHNTVPNYAWISPDQCHDMHGRAGVDSSDPCDFSNESKLIAAGDQFLQSTVSAIMHSRAWNDDSVIFITWDESDFTHSGPAGFGDTRGCCDANPGGGHVLTLVITRDGGARGSFQLYNHYSMLKTVEEIYHLGCLANTCDAAHVHPMFDLVMRER